MQTCIHTFETAAFFHREIAARLLSRLELIRLQPQYLAELNCATGYLTRLLQQRYPKTAIIGLDPSVELLHYANNKKKWFHFFAKNPVFITANSTELPFIDHSIDLLIANLFYFAVDADLQALIKQWQRVLKPGGLLMFSTMGPDTLQELRQCWAQVGNAHPVPPFLDMHDIGDQLLKAGFMDPVMDREDYTLNYKNVQQLWRDLKNLRLYNKKLVFRKTQLTTVSRAYENFRHENYLPVSVEVLYAHAWAPTAPKTLSKEIAVPLNSIKRLKASSNN